MKRKKVADTDQRNETICMKSMVTGKDKELPGKKEI
jgi:hypothetical protein